MSLFDDAVASTASTLRIADGSAEGRSLAIICYRVWHDTQRNQALGAM